MKVLIQVVNSASVIVENKIVGKINKGYLLFVGFCHGDNKQIIEKMVNKIIDLRIFPDEFGKTNLALNDVNGEILSISQFTLYADASKGRRPSFIEALKGEESSILYDIFNNLIKEKIGKIEKGIFGADMKVSLENDGPFTLILDSKYL